MNLSVHACFVADFLIGKTRYSILLCSLFEGLLFSVVGSGAAYWFLSAKTVLPNDMGRDEHAVDASSTMLAASSSLDTTLPRLAPAGVDDSEQEVDASSKSLHVIPAETTQLPIDVGFADERPLPGDLESTTETGSSRGEAADAGTGFHTPPRASTQTPMTELASHPLSPGVLDGREPMSPPGIGPSRLVFDGDEKTPKALRGLWPGPPGQPGRVVWEANNLRVVAMAIRHTGRPNAEVVEMSATVLEWSPGHVAWTAVGAPFETLVVRMSCAAVVAAISCEIHTLSVSLAWVPIKTGCTPHPCGCAGSRSGGGFRQH